MAPTDPGAERAAGGVVLVVQRICVPLVQGGHLKTIARTVGLRMEHGDWVYPIDRSQRIELAPPDPANPHLCNATIVHDVGAQAAIRQALDNWARSQTPPLQEVKDEVQSVGPVYQRTTSTWSGSSPLGVFGVVFAAEKTLQGKPVRGDLGQSEVLASFAPTSPAAAPISR